VIAGQDDSRGRIEAMTAITSISKSGSGREQWLQSEPHPGNEAHGPANAPTPRTTLPFPSVF